MSLGTGRPIVLRDEISTRHCRLLLSHRFSSPTDVRLVALIELVAQKSSYCPSDELLLLRLQPKFMRPSCPWRALQITIQLLLYVGQALLWISGGRIVMNCIVSFTIMLMKFPKLYKANLVTETSYSGRCCALNCTIQSFG